MNAEASEERRYSITRVMAELSVPVLSREQSHNC